MSCGYWLRVHGKWMPLDGVQAGVPISPDRNVSEFRSLGGRRSVSRSRRVAREWSLDFTHATPAAVRLLALAANGQAGDVMLLDVSQARANMLDPLRCVGGDDMPLIDVAGLSLRSVTLDAAGPATADVRPSVAQMVRSDTPNTTWTGPLLIRSSPASHGIVRISVPADPASRTLSSAELVLTPSTTPSGTPTVTAYAMSNAWVGPSLNWNTAPAAGASVGSAALSGGRWTIPISGISAFRGTDMSLRLQIGSGSTTLLGGLDPNSPYLRLSYTLNVVDHTFSSLVRGGQPYVLSAYTDVDAGGTVLTYNTGGASAAVSAPIGTGPRLASATFTPATDGVLSGVVPAGTDGSVSALRLTEGTQVGPWIPGQKTPVRVAVSDPSQTLNWLLAGEQGRSDYQVMLREVG